MLKKLFNLFFRNSDNDDIFLFRGMVVTRDIEREIKLKGIESAFYRNSGPSVLQDRLQYLVDNAYRHGNMKEYVKIDISKDGFRKVPEAYVGDSSMIDKATSDYLWYAPHLTTRLGKAVSYAMHGHTTFVTSSKNPQDYYGVVYVIKVKKGEINYSPDGAQPYHKVQALLDQQGKTKWEEFYWLDPVIKPSDIFAFVNIGPVPEYVKERSLKKEDVLNRVDYVKRQLNL